MPKTDQIRQRYPCAEMRFHRATFGILSATKSLSGSSTPLVKSLLAKRRKLCRQDRKEAADDLALKSNRLISEFRIKQFG